MYGVCCMVRGDYCALSVWCVVWVCSVRCMVYGVWCAVIIAHSVCVCVVACFFSYNTCSTSLPSGNRVDGLPLVVNCVLLESNTGEGVIGSSFGWSMGRDPIVFNMLCLCQIVTPFKRVQDIHNILSCAKGRDDPFT